MSSKEEDKGRNVVTRTDSEAKKKKLEEYRKAQGSRKISMFLHIHGEDITTREFFGKTLIPFDAVVKKMAIMIPDTAKEVTLKVRSDLGIHSSQDTFRLESGYNRLNRQVIVEEGTTLQFSLEHENEELKDVYISGILQTK